MRLPSTDRGRLLFVLALVTAVTVFTATVPLLRDWFDLRVYHGAVDAWIHHGGSVYDYRVPGTTYGFTYPPFAAVSMLPMALLGLHAAIAVGLLLNLAATAFVLHVLAGDRLRRYGWFGLAVTVCRSPFSNRSATPSASARSTSCCWPSSSATPGCCRRAVRAGPASGSGSPPRSS
jgi:alpha-1,2-mannosyltransferase